MMQVLPQFLVSPMAGVINDRHQPQAGDDLRRLDRARAIVLCMMLGTVARDAMAACSCCCSSRPSAGLCSSPPAAPWFRTLPKRDQIPVANALGAATWSVNFALGAGLGGLVAVAFGRNTVFVLNSLSFVAVGAVDPADELRRTARRQFAAAHGSRCFSIFRRSRTESATCARDPKLLATIFVKGGAGLMGSNWVILPVLGERVFPVHLHGLSAQQAGTLGMSTLLASRGMGAMFGAYLGGNLAGLDHARLRYMILAGFCMAAAGYMALGAAGSLAAAVLTLLVAHAGGSAVWTASTTLLQQQTDDRFRGRVFSAEFAFTTLTLAISSLVAGRFVDAGVGVRTVAVATGMVMVIPAGVWFLAGKAWRNQAPVANARGSE